MLKQSQERAFFPLALQNVLPWQIQTVVFYIPQLKSYKSQNKNQTHRHNTYEKTVELLCVSAPTLRSGARCIYTRTAHADEHAELAA